MIARSGCRLAQYYVIGKNDCSVSQLLLSLAPPLHSTIASWEVMKWFGVVCFGSTTASFFWVVSHTPLAAMSELAILDGAFTIIVEPAHFQTPQWQDVSSSDSALPFWGPHLFWSGTTQLVIEGHIHPCPVFFASRSHFLSEGHIVLLPCQPHNTLSSL